jgi:hypothetical protein
MKPAVEGSDTENALFAAGAPTLEAADLESVPLLSDEFTPSQQAALRNEFLSSKSLQADGGEQLDGGTLGGELTGDSAAAVRAVVARLTEAPPNFHQATSYFAATAAPEDAPMAARAPLFFLASALMVLMQTVTAMGVCWGVVLPSCSTSEQCQEGHAGTYCSVRDRSRCDFCGRWVPLEIEFQAEMSQAVTDLCRLADGKERLEMIECDTASGTMNWAEDPEFIGFNRTLVAEVCAAPASRRGTRGNGDNNAVYLAATVASWCETCVHAIDGTVDASTQTGRISSNISAMSKVDFIALAFATFIVACKVVGELKDIELCALSVAHAGAELSRGWRLALMLLGGVRRRMFLPMLVTTVPVLVMLKGGDALSVCFNTVAILFMCAQTLHSTKQPTF